MSLKYLSMVQALAKQTTFFPPDRFVPDIKPIRDAYLENIERIYSLAGLGMQIEVCRRREGDDDLIARPLSPHDIETAASYIDLLATKKRRVGNGLVATMDGMLTSGWTTFEVLASDLWEAAINAHPRGLADLRGSPKRIIIGTPFSKYLS